MQSTVKGIKRKEKAKKIKKKHKPFHHGLHIILKDEIGRTKIMRKKKNNLNQLG
jgi:hypothetical protein